MTDQDPAAFFTSLQDDAFRKWQRDNAGLVQATIGYSHGADLAATAFSEGVGRGTDLHTVEPVGLTWPDFRAIADNAYQWHDYEATGGGLTLPNAMAFVGRAYGTAPAKFANHHREPLDHADIVGEVVPKILRLYRRYGDE